ncbi:MAG: hypothetical protein IH860_02765 [Chloroflexi bacterium]|nr:hypothetical protein [Chloroflexota bacterium]
MAKWVIILVGLALVVGIGAGTAFALTDSGDNPPELDSQRITDETQGGQGPIRSDEDIDPNECNLVHNIDACDEDDLKALRGAPILGSTPLAPGTEVEGEPEPLSLDGGPGFKIECDEGEGVYITSTGEVGCTALFALEAVGEAETQEQLPQVEPQVP